MTFYTPAIVSLMLSLPVALGFPLKVILVTDWSDGLVTPSIASPTKVFDIKALTHSLDIKILNPPNSDTKKVWDIYDLTFERSDPSDLKRFRVQREEWGIPGRLDCDITVVGDPEVDVVHILLEGGKEDIRPNGYEDFVKVDCYPV